MKLDTCYPQTCAYFGSPQKRKTVVEFCRAVFLNLFLFPLGAFLDTFFLITSLTPRNFNTIHMLYISLCV